MLTFTEEEVRRIIGNPVDVEGRFEEAHRHEDGEWCMSLSIEEDESDEVTGEKVAHYANMVSAVAQNELIGQQLARMRKIGGVTR